MKGRLLLVCATCLPLLQGCVGVFMAGAATTASVANDRRSVGSIVDDQSIEMRVANAIASRKDMDKASRIEGISLNGKVLLVGQTPYTQYRQEAEQLVAKQEGVRHVYNEIRIGQPAGFSQQSTDTWITSKIKTNMLTTKGMDSTRFKVITENGEVFLMGMVTHEEADKAVNLTRSISGVKKVVKVFEYIQKKDGSSSGSNTESTTESTTNSSTTSTGTTGGTDEVQMGGPAEEVVHY